MVGASPIVEIVDREIVHQVRIRSGMGFISEQLSRRTDEPPEQNGKISDVCPEIEDGMSGVDILQKVFGEGHLICSARRQFEGYTKIIGWTEELASM
jgi:hypothetical protein